MTGLSVTGKLVLVLGVAAVVVPLVASATAPRLDLRIYDPAHAAKVQVTAAGVVRSSAKADRDPTTGTAILSILFTKQGDAQFAALTRALAHRGARLHRELPFVVEIDGWRDRVFIDYKAYPEGLSAGGGGVQLTGMKLTTARKLAALIRRG